MSGKYFALRKLAFILISIAVILQLPTTAAAEDANTAQKEKDNWTFWLGPTGLRGYCNRKERVFEVLQITSGSPADGKIGVGEIIIGANGKAFSAIQPTDTRIKYDDLLGPLPNLGMAIEEAEGNPKLRGILTLNIRTKGGKNREAKIKLEQLGYFAPTYPYDCKKTDIIFDRLCEWINNNIGGGAQARCVMGLALLGHGDPKYTSTIKNIADHFVKQSQGDGKKGFVTWNQSYTLFFLSEYYLATKDESALEAIQWNYDRLCEGQFDYYGSGHGYQNGNYRGGGIGICTTHAMLGFSMAMLCPIKADDERMEKTKDHIKDFTSPKNGGLEYGKTWKGGGDQSSGRTGCGALAFHFFGDRPEQGEHIAGWFEKYYHYMHGAHTSPNLGFIWGGLAMATYNRENFMEFMRYDRFYHNLQRAPTHQFYLNPGDRRGSVGGDGYMKDIWASGGMGLILATSRGKLRLTGGHVNIPGISPNKLSKNMRKIYDVFAKEKYKVASVALGRLAKTKPIKNEVRQQESDDAWKMLDYMAFTMVDTDYKKLLQHKREGDYYMVQQIYLSIKKTFGQMPRYKTRIKNLGKFLSRRDVAPEVRAGKAFYGHKALAETKPKDAKRRLEGFIKAYPNSYYAAKAEEVIAMITPK